MLMQIGYEKKNSVARCMKLSNSYSLG
uniref:Uncharacterized protein n=1 Tax=Arundo donax TaxID=35708 RepID=A0A0A8YED7_ARUDO